MSILFIAGSPHAASRSSLVLEHLQQRLERVGHNVGWIHLGELPAEDLIHQRRESLHIARAIDSVKRADGIVIAGPIYKSAPAGLIKVFLDLLPQHALKDKVLLPLATAGGAAHYLSLDCNLKPVLSALGAVSIAPSIYLQDQQLSVDQAGNLQLDGAANARIETALTSFLRYLSVASVEIPVEQSLRRAVSAV